MSPSIRGRPVQVFAEKDDDEDIVVDDVYDDVDDEGDNDEGYHDEDVDILWDL